MIKDNMIQYTTTVEASPEKVWDALTKPEIVKQYFFGSNLKSSWEIGSPISFSGEYEGKSYEDKGTVVEYNPEKKLAFSYLSSWSGKEDKPENYLYVSYEIRPTANGTELTISQSNYDAERASHSRENWKSVMDDMKKLVE